MVVGNEGVGKTTLIQTFVGFQQNISDMVEKASFIEKYIKDVKVGISNSAQETSLRLHIWDTSLQEKYKSSTPMYYRDADAAIFMLDLNDERSLKDIDNYWMNAVLDYGPENIVLAIVAIRS